MPNPGGRRTAATHGPPAPPRSSRPRVACPSGENVQPFLKPPARTDGGRRATSTQNLLGAAEPQSQVDLRTAVHRRRQSSFRKGRDRAPFGPVGHSTKTRVVHTVDLADTVSGAARRERGCRSRCARPPFRCRCSSTTHPPRNPPAEVAPMSTLHRKEGHITPVHADRLPWWMPL